LPLEAGQLRHYIDIERKKNVQNLTSGLIQEKWIKDFEAVPVKIENKTAWREVEQSAEIQAEVTSKVIMRLVPGLNATQRFVHGRYCCQELGEEILNPGRPLRDPQYGLEYAVFNCSQGVNEG